jgi:hypothetical protein
MDASVVLLVISIVTILVSFFSIVRKFVAAGRSSTRVKIQVDGDTIELTTTDPKDAERLIDAYLRRYQDTSIDSQEKKKDLPSDGTGDSSRGLDSEK